MQKQKHKLPSEDDEVRSQKSHYTNVSKLSSKHVELSLEVEMDDEVREIIKYPTRCSSALLDVTVIKPKGLDKYITEKQILKTDQVKQMIASIKLDSKDKETLMKKLFGDYDESKEIDEKGEKINREHHDLKELRKKSCFSSKNKQQFRQTSMKLDQGDVRCVTDEANSVVRLHDQAPVHKGGIRTHQHQQIYTSPRTYDNVRTMFACTNKDKRYHENEKMEPCLCQNCAIVGILTDSQKKPFATEPIPAPTLGREPRYKKPTRRKSVSFKHLENLSPTSGTHEHEQCEAIFKLLASRISELERRVALQEEKAVPKDYFKKIITKLVTHLTKLTHYNIEGRSMTSSHRHKDPPQSIGKYKSSDRPKYFVNPILVENTYKVTAEKEYDPKPCSSTETPKSHSESIWKWGEEFLTSGRDLKNKVVVLLEETLHNLKKGWEKPQVQGRYDKDIHSMVEELSKNLAQTVRSKTARNRSPGEAPHQSGKTSMSNAMKTKAPMTPRSTTNRKSEKPSLIPRFMRNEKGQRRSNRPTVNVAYINPQLGRWPEESSVSFKIDSSDYEVQKENMSEAKKRQYKKEFLKVLDNTKTADKFKLWQSIWNQALENRQTKKDIVSIQIPDPKDLIRQKMIHLEYTIGDLEKLLTSGSNRDDNKK